MSRSLDKLKDGLTLGLVLICFSACTTEKHYQISAPKQNSAPKDGAGTKKDAQLQGTLSGGGNFGDTVGTMLLKAAAKELATHLRRSSPEIYAELPKGWSVETMAKLIEDVRFNAREDCVRENIRLRFDYGTDKNGAFIKACQLFFESVSAVNVDTAYDSELRGTIEQIKVDLAHEVAHHFGIGLSYATDNKARQFGRDLVLKSLNTNGHVCWPEGFSLEETAEIVSELVNATFEAPDWETVFPDDQNKRNRAATLMLDVVDRSGALKIPPGLLITFLSRITYMLDDYRWFRDMNADNINPSEYSRRLYKSTQLNENLELKLEGWNGVTLETKNVVKVKGEEPNEDFSYQEDATGKVTASYTFWYEGLANLPQFDENENPLPNYDTTPKTYTKTIPLQCKTSAKPIRMQDYL